MGEQFGCVLLLVLLVTGFLTGLFALVRWECFVLTDGIGVPARWSMVGGCRVMQDGRWISLDNWAYVGNMEAGDQ